MSLAPRDTSRGFPVVVLPASPSHQHDHPATSSSLLPSYFFSAAFSFSKWEFVSFTIVKAITNSSAAVTIMPTKAAFLSPRCNDIVEVRWLAVRSGDADGVHHVVLLDLLRDIDALRHLAEHRVHAVQVPRGVLVEHDEELAAPGVLAGVRHRERAELVLSRVSLRLALDHVAGAA